jgi:hypothetical protein
VTAGAAHEFGGSPDILGAESEVGARRIGTPRKVLGVVDVALHQEVLVSLEVLRLGELLERLFVQPARIRHT